MRTNNFQVGEAPRNSGSFTSSFGLASFLVPAGVFALVLAYMDASAAAARRDRVSPVHGGRDRLLHPDGAGRGIVAGTLVLAALMVRGAGVSARRRRYAAGLIVLVLVGGYGATLVAGTADERAGDAPRAS